MNKRLARLQARKAALAAEMRQLLDAADNEGRELSAEEQATYDGHDAEIAKLDADIAREQKLAATEAALATVPNPAGTAETETLTAARPRIDVRQPRPRHFDSAEDAYLSGQFLRAIGWQDAAALNWCREHGVSALASQSGMNTGANSAGGYLVPEELSSAIIRLVENYGVFRSRARVVPMSSDSLIMPRRTAGLTSYFTGENNDTTATQITFDAVQLVAKKLSAVCRYSSELGEDAVVSLADYIANEIAYAFALKEDQCGFLGDGTSTYGGIFGVFPKIDDGTHAASIYTALAGNTAFSTLDLADFVGVTGKLPLYARGRAAWYISAAGFADSMERLMYAGGGNTVSTIGGGSGPSFLGYPVVLSQVCNSTLTAQTSTVVALFGDLSSAATMGTRRGVTMTVARERYIEYGQVAVFGDERFDINCHDLGDASTAGPIIALKTPGS